MIQRKQTLWLLLASLITVLAFFIPFGVNKTNEVETILNAKSNIILMVITIVTIIDCFFIIFLYKNRKLQLKLSILPIITALAMLLYEVYICYFTQNGNKLIIGLYGSQLFLGVFIPVVVIAFIAMAINGIKHDEKLIKEMDRLR